MEPPRKRARDTVSAATLDTFSSSTGDIDPPRARDAREEIPGDVEGASVAPSARHSAPTLGLWRGRLPADLETCVLDHFCFAELLRLQTVCRAMSRAGVHTGAVVLKRVRPPPSSSPWTTVVGRDGAVDIARTSAAADRSEAPATARLWRAALQCERIHTLAADSAYEAPADFCLLVGKHAPHLRHLEVNEMNDRAAALQALRACTALETLSLTLPSAPHSRATRHALASDVLGLDHGRLRELRVTRPLSGLDVLLDALAERGARLDVLEIHPGEGDDAAWLCGRLLPALARHPLRALDLLLEGQSVPLAFADRRAVAAALAATLEALRGSLRRLALAWHYTPLAGDTPAGAAGRLPPLPLFPEWEALRVSSGEIAFAPQKAGRLALRSLAVLSDVSTPLDDAHWDWAALDAATPALRDLRVGSHTGFQHLLSRHAARALRAGRPPGPAEPGAALDDAEPETGLGLNDVEPDTGLDDAEPPLWRDLVSLEYCGGLPLDVPLLVWPRLERLVVRHSQVVPSRHRARGPYLCCVCSQPKKGHVCTGVPAPRPVPPPRPRSPPVPLLAYNDSLGLGQRPSRRVHEALTTLVLQCEVPPPRLFALPNLQRLEVAAGLRLSPGSLRTALSVAPASWRALHHYVTGAAASLTDVGWMLRPVADPEEPDSKSVGDPDAGESAEEAASSSSGAGRGGREGEANARPLFPPLPRLSRLSVHIHPRSAQFFDATVLRRHFPPHLLARLSFT